MDLIQRRRVMLAAGKRPRLPREYQEVEWLGSSGTQYIDTNLVLTQDSEIFLRVSFKSTNPAEYSCFGCRQDANSRNVGIAGTSAYSIYADFGPFSEYRAWPGSPYAPNDVYEITINKQIRLIYNATKKVNSAENTKYYSSNFSTPGSALIFNQRNGFSQNGMHGYIFKCEINDSISENRIMIPCYRKSDNKPGMYDLCGSICPLTNSPFYINAGTGEFVVGPDVN